MTGFKALSDMSSWELAKFKLGCQLAQNIPEGAWKRLCDIYEWQGDLLKTLAHKYEEKKLFEAQGRLRWSLAYLKMTMEFIKHE